MSDWQKQASEALGIEDIGYISATNKVVTRINGKTYHISPELWANTDIVTYIWGETFADRKTPPKVRGIP